MSKSDGFFVGNHVVSFIDILGQKKRLASWPPLPAGGTPTTDLVKAVKETAGAVLAFKEHFVNFFKSADRQSTPDWLTSLDQEQQMGYQRIKDCKLSIQQFSDLFVFYSPIFNTFGDISTLSLYRTLNACAMAMLISLGARVPVRGAVTLGAGVELDKCSFYGPALFEAYHLEAEVADYPRVVVSDTVQAFLAEGQVYSSDLKVNEMMKRVAVNCRALLAEDDDGLCIVDFIGNGIHALVGQATTWPKCVQSVYDFALVEERRFKAKGDPKLASRYRRLRNYLESRLSIWGLDSTLD